MRRIIVAVLSILAAAPALAENPSMTAKAYFAGEDEERDLSLVVTKLDIAVRVYGGYAETKATVSFRNPTEQTLEGELALTMPRGSIVTGYALDVEGRMIDGVLLDKPVAKKTFEARIREGVDPGLAEALPGDIYRNRVFPVNADQTRTVALTFVSTVNAAAPYMLPLQTGAPVEAVSVSVFDPRGQPFPQVSIGGEFAWSRTESRAGVVSEATAKNVKLDGALTIRPRDIAPLTIETTPAGERFLAFIAPAPKSDSTAAPKSVRVYWDASLSHKAAAARDRAFIDKAVQAFPQASFEFVTFATEPNSALATRALPEEIRYAGATNLEALFEAESRRPRADLCVLVSDGRFTVGKFPEKKAPCRLHAVSSAKDADRGALSLLARRNGGRLLDLSAGDAAALNALVQPAVTLDAFEIDGKPADGEWSEEGGAFRLTAPLPRRARRVSIEFGGERYSASILSAAKVEGRMASAAWAHARLGALRAEGERRSKLVDLSKRYGVASDETSFIVLESVDDYAEARTPLPAGAFDAEERAEYAELIASYEEEDREAREERLDDIVDAWKEMVEWWESKPEPKGKKDEPRPPADVVEQSPADAAETPPLANLPAPAASVPDAEALVGDSDEIVVTGSRIGGDDAESESIEITPWSPDRPYLTAVKGLCVDAFLSEFARQTETYGAAPSFYLEMSDAAARCGDTRAARDIALSALELPLSNTDTMAAVAHRLLDIGETALGVDLLRKVASIDSHRPQPLRDLALALDAASRAAPPADARAYDREAIDALVTIVETPWDDDYDGIELIAVMEANRILARSKSTGAGSSALDPRLRKLLDVDLRIVVSWNVDDVDMDLWVTEPSGEVAKYSNPNTSIGGRLSNDMTDGYGPEEYLVRRAVPGEFAVAVDLFDEDVINPNGAVIVRAEIFRNWGRPNETSEVVNFELTDDDAEVLEIAKAKFAEADAR